MRVVDLRQYVGPCVYVGRPIGGTRARDGSPLANPFTPRLHGADCLRFYREWLEARVADGWPPVHRALAAISRVSVLGCWCVNLANDHEILNRPLVCHAQVIWGVWQLNYGGPAADRQEATR